MKNNTVVLAGLAAAFALLHIAGNLYGEEAAGPPATTNAPGRVVVSDASVFGDMTEAEIIAWLRAPEAEPADAGTKPAVQVVMIELAEDAIDETTGSIDIPTEFLDAGQPQPEWYEWVDPRLFIEQWAEWWASETNATPVVLILIKF